MAGLKKSPTYLSNGVFESSLSMKRSFSEPLFSVFAMPLEPVNSIFLSSISVKLCSKLAAEPEDEKRPRFGYFRSLAGCSSRFFRLVRIKNPLDRLKRPPGKELNRQLTVFNVVDLSHFRLSGSQSRYEKSVGKQTLSPICGAVRKWRARCSGSLYRLERKQTNAVQRFEADRRNSVE